MARGWESKSVEAQQAEAGEKTARPKAAMTAEAAARWRERENLRLARSRVLQQMAGTPNPRYLALLNQTLVELDNKVQRLQAGPRGSEAASPDV
jgi:hypothetical protein